MLSDTGQRKARKLGLLVYASLVVVLAATSVLLLAYTYFRSAAFTSDDLLCTAVCDDLLHGRDVTSWYLPGAPYLFPDIALLTPCQWLTPHVLASFLAYGFAFHFCLLGVLLTLGRMTGLSRWRALTAAGCGEIAGRPPPRRQRLDACLPPLHPGSHTGVVLVGLALLALTVRSLHAVEAGSPPSCFFCWAR